MEFSSKPVTELVRTACLLEATARKPGNVHPWASFADLHYRDFVASAHTIAPIVAKTSEIGMGRAVFEAVSATRAAVGRNTNLGIVLLLVPLAAVPQEVSLRDGIGKVLEDLTREDARLVYRAIRTAQPGGMGAVDHEDVSQDPQGTLREAMALAADRDLIAAQYAGRFETVLDIGASQISAGDLAGLTAGKVADVGESAPADDRGFAPWEQAVIRLHLGLMARFPDSLIARKCGMDEARESARRAQQVLDADWPDGETGRREFQSLDRWLRERGNLRNPGTTADLVTACLFAVLREETFSR